MAYYRCGGGADTSAVTASAADVLSGKVIIDKDGNPITGAMPDNGAKTAALNCGGSYTIPKGFHNGSGKVTANSLASQTPGTATASDIARGKTAYVNGTKITGTSGVVTIDGVKPTGNVTLKSEVCDISLGEMPKSYNFNVTVVYNNEIHLLYADSNGNGYHYKWNGSMWTEVKSSPSPSSFPFCIQGSAVVYNNEIHVLGGIRSSRASKYHYKWNVSLGSRWTQLNDLPYSFQQGSAVVYNNEIHILGGDVGGSGVTKHYKWNGSSWTSVSTLPYEFWGGSAVVYNNEIHILGGGAATVRNRHYKWNGSTWTSAGTLPYAFQQGSAVVYNNEIHLLGGNSSEEAWISHYKWNGSTWTNVSTLPFSFYGGSSVVYDNDIHILGGQANMRSHCIVTCERYRKVV